MIPTHVWLTLIHTFPHARDRYAYRPVTMRSPTEMRVLRIAPAFGNNKLMILYKFLNLLPYIFQTDHTLIMVSLKCRMSDNNIFILP